MFQTDKTSCSVIFWRFFKTGGSLSREAGKHQRAIQAGHEVSREQYRVSLEKIPFKNYDDHDR